MNTIKQDPKATAQQIARQIAQEPFEILKSAREQISGPAAPIENKTPEPEKPVEDNQLEQKMQLQGQRQLEALDREIKDIAKQKLLKELQERINQGQEINLAGYPDLTLEEREVLFAQIQAVKIRQQAAHPAPLIQPSSKPDRKFAGEGLGAKRQQTHVERPLPPSG